MGCASSTAASDVRPRPAQQQPEKTVQQHQQVQQGTPPASAQGITEQKLQNQGSSQNATDLQPLSAELKGRPDSPTERRVAPQTLIPKQRDDGIPVIDGDVGDEEEEPRASTIAKPAPQHPLGPYTTSSNGTPPYDDPDNTDVPTNRKGWTRGDSIKAATPAVVMLAGKNGSLSDSLDAVLTTLEMGPGAGKVAAGGGGRYGKAANGGQPTTLDLSDSDDEDGKPGFDMARWKRYYHWNRKKPTELARWLWKRFDARAWSVFCVSYVQQAGIFAAYQGENLIHGLACRLEERMAKGGGGPMSDLFGVLHTLADTGSESFKVVGVFILKGSSPVPPRELSDALEPGDWAISKADPQDPLVRTFLSTLIASQSPVQQQYNIVCTRELL